MRPLRVLLDGGSGSGKTTLARQLAGELEALLGERVQLVHMDDLYPGWHGLAEGSRIVAETVLDERSPRYPRWDWQGNARAGWVHLDPALPLLVEGCGAITRKSAVRADWRIWLEEDAEPRKRRALARDQGGFEAWWDIWAGQELVHWRTNRPWQLADVVLNGLVDDRILNAP